MTHLLDIAFSGFWQFCGALFLIYGLLYFGVNGIVLMWGRFMRMIMVTWRGWPPSHLDADGDHIFQKKDS